MAVDAGQVVAGVAFLRISRVLADLLRRIDDEVVSVANDIVLGVRRQLRDVALIPIGGPAPNEVPDAKTHCRRHDERNACDQVTRLHELFTPLMRDATAAKGSTLSGFCPDRADRYAPRSRRDGSKSSEHDYRPRMRDEGG